MVDKLSDEEETVEMDEEIEAYENQKEIKPLMSRRQFSRFYIHVQDEKEFKDLENTETYHPIFDGIYRNNYTDTVEALNTMVQNDVNKVRYAGQSPLHAACLMGNLDILKVILEHGAKVNVTNCYGNTPLHVSVNESWTEGVKLLLEYQATLDILTGNLRTVREVRKETPFHLAIRKGDLPILQFVLNQNLNMRIKDSEQNTVVHLAAESQSPDVLKLILHYNKYCTTFSKAKNMIGNTPLHSLLKQGLESDESSLVQCVTLLLEKGADINAQNNSGETPLYIACKDGLPDIVNFLLKNGASPTILTEYEESCVHASCEASSPECLIFILHKENTNRLVLKNNIYKQSPFHKAVASHSLDCCLILLENGDHLSIKDENGTTKWQLMLENMSNATHLMKRLFDDSIFVSSKKINDPNFRVSFNYQMLLYQEDYNIQKSLIEELNLAKFEDLLKHPLIESFLYIKWSKIKPFFYIYVFLYASLILIHTIFVMISLNGLCEDIESVRIYQIFVFLYVLFFLLIFISDIIVIFANVRRYLKQFETYIKMLSLITSAAFISILKRQQSEMPQRNLAAISLFFGWMELMILLGRFPTFGSYSLMFTKISVSIVKFLFSFSFLLVGFSCAFRVLFSEVDSFSSLPLTFLKTTMMMIGEIEYGDIFAQSNLTQIFRTDQNHSQFHLYFNDFLKIAFLIAFLILVPILMANLLIGLAVNDIPELRRKGQIERLSKQASYLVSFENTLHSMKANCFFPNFLRKFLIKRTNISVEVEIYANKKKQTGKHTINIPSKTLQVAISTAMNNECGLAESENHDSKIHDDKDLLVMHHQHFHQALDGYLQKVNQAAWQTENEISIRKIEYLTREIHRQSKDFKDLSQKLISKENQNSIHHIRSYSAKGAHQSCKF